MVGTAPSLRTWQSVCCVIQCQALLVLDAMQSSIFVLQISIFHGETRINQLTTKKANLTLIFCGRRSKYL